MSAWDAGRRLLVGLTALTLLTGCGASATPTQNAATSPTTTPTSTATPALSATPSPSVSPTPNPITPAPVAIPSARGYESMAYDSKAERVIMYGGQTGDYKLASSYNSDTWSFDPATSVWTRMNPATSPGGTIGAMAYDSKADRVILVVNADPSAPAALDFARSQTWVYDFVADTWTRLADGPSPGRIGAGIVYDSAADRIVLFGGVSVLGGGVYYNDTWTFNLKANKWTQMHPARRPEARNYQGMAYDSKADRTVVWGGDVGGTLKAPLWVYDYKADSWKEVTYDKGPTGRDYCSLVYDQRADRFILFGGLSTGSDDTWTYALDSNTWALIQPAPKPPLLSRQAMAYDTNTDTTVLFGGWEGSTPYNFKAGTWVLDLNAPSWTNVTPG